MQGHVPRIPGDACAGMPAVAWMPQPGCARAQRGQHCSILVGGEDADRGPQYAAGQLGMQSSATRLPRTPRPRIAQGKCCRLLAHCVRISLQACIPSMRGVTARSCSLTTGTMPGHAGQHTSRGGKCGRPRLQSRPLRSDHMSPCAVPWIDPAAVIIEPGCEISPATRASPVRMRLHRIQGCNCHRGHRSADLWHCGILCPG